MYCFNCPHSIAQSAKNIYCKRFNKYEQKNNYCPDEEVNAFTLPPLPDETHDDGQDAIYI